MDHDRGDSMNYALPMADVPEYDVALSFAGEDREYVREVADVLRNRGMRTFFDEHERVKLWGKDLYAHLHYVYSKAAYRCVIFVSKHYAEKVWPTHERESAMEKALQEPGEYLLPVRFDDTPVPGLKNTISFLDLNELTPADLAELIVAKVGMRQLNDYFPPKPDRLFDQLGLTDNDLIQAAHSTGYAFYQTLRRMNEEERYVVLTTFLQGCPAELPDNVHINLDLLRRLTDLPPRQIVDDVVRIASLGYEYVLRDSHDHEESSDSDDQVLVLSWQDLTLPEDETDVQMHSVATRIGDSVVKAATSGLCEDHAIDRLMNLDFGQLATPTVRTDEELHEASIEAG
jgi:hypothetical protein